MKDIKDIQRTIRLLIFLISAILPFASFAKGANELIPRNKSHNVCVDTHLSITFREPSANKKGQGLESRPKLGTRGKIRVFDAKTGEAVDSIDISIPAGPTEPRTYGADCDYIKKPYDYSRDVMPTNRTVRPGTPSGGAEPNPSCYQLSNV